MFLFEEKRKLPDRRTRNDGPPPGCRERRTAGDRRQTVMAEITLQEWTRCFVKFKERCLARKRLEAMGNTAAATTATTAARVEADA